MRALLKVTLVAALMSAGSPAAFAQTPSADEIMQAIMPNGALSTKTRGLKPQHPVPPATTATQATPAAAAVPAPSAASPAAPPPAAADDSAPSISLSVQFATGSAQLTPAATRTLDELGKALSSQTLASYRFRIEGHTDTVGSRPANLALSQARAAAVVAYLSSRFGVAPDRLVAVGLGSDGLLVPTPDQTAEPRNRRVKVVNLGA